MCDTNFSTDGYCQASAKLKDSYSQTSKSRRKKKPAKVYPNIVVRVQVPPTPKVLIKEKHAAPEPTQKNTRNI